MTAAVTEQAPRNDWTLDDEYSVAGTSTELIADACAALALTVVVADGLPSCDLGNLGYGFDFPTDVTPAETTLIVPPDLFGCVQDLDLDLTLVLTALPVVLDNVAAALEAGDSVPLIGDGLEDLGDATQQANDDFVRPLTEELLNVLSTRIGDLQDAGECDLGADPADEDCGIVD